MSKYNGMLSIIVWDLEEGRFVAWSLRGRTYFSLGPSREHPVTSYFDKTFSGLEGIAFIGETYVARMIHGKAYMTEFNKRISIIKNPASQNDVERIRLALFDYATIDESRVLSYDDSAIDRFRTLLSRYGIPVGCDSDIVHLADHITISDSVKNHQKEVQAFWDEYIKERGFEGLVLCLEEGDRYKLKYRDTLDVAIIAYRILERSEKIRPVCEDCGTRFDALWLKKLARKRLH